MQYKPGKREKGRKTKERRKTGWFREKPKKPIGFRKTQRFFRKPKNPIKNKDKEEDKEKDINKHNVQSQANALFERLWKLYPQKRGKGQVSEANKRRLLDIGYDKMSRAIDRYKADLANDEWRKPQNGSTFFNSGYVDYLDENYERPAENKKNSANFKQRTYDYGAIEERFIRKINGTNPSG